MFQRTRLGMENLIQAEPSQLTSRPLRRTLVTLALHSATITSEGTAALGFSMVSRMDPSSNQSQLTGRQETRRPFTLFQSQPRAPGGTDRR